MKLKLATSLLALSLTATPLLAQDMPRGAPDKTPDGIALAGRVAKGTHEGCIACRSVAEGDMVFTSGHLLN